MFDDMKDWLAGLMKASLEGFDDMLADAADVLANGLGDWDTVLAISNTLKPFCYVIIGICLLIEFAQVASRVDIIKWEHGLKMGVKMVLAKVCIDIAPDFLKACYVQAQEWVTSLASFNSTLGTTAYDSIEDVLAETTGLGAILGLFLSSFIVLMAVKICGIMVQVIAYGRMFEIYVYLVVSPVPCAFFPLGGGDGAGISRVTSKFFKAFAAVCLQGVMMVIVMRIFDVIIGNALETVLVAAASEGDAATAVTNVIYTMLLGSIVLVMSIVKSGQWAKSILDAN